MKKFLFIFIASTLSLLAQIPNSGFEIWENYVDSIGGCTPPYNVYEKPNNWVGFLPKSCSTYSFSIEKNLENYPPGTGQFSMLIKNDLPNDVNGGALSYDEFPSNLSFPNIPPAFPINHRPTNLCLYYKYTPANVDTMTILCYFYKNGIKIGEAKYISNRAVSIWSSLIIPTSFYNTEIPDSATILFLTFYNINSQQNGSKLYIDNVSFDTLVTSVGNKNVFPPENFKLSQNFPNPFNPVTQISYSLPKAGFITLKVSDVLGREVATLVNEYKEAGYYEVSWDATIVPSGIYFYKMQAGNFTSVKKMVVMR